MSSLEEITDQLASAVVSAEPDDLQGLAQIHGRIEAFNIAAREALPSAADRGKAAGKLIEQIIFGQVGDASAALKSVCGMVTEIQNIMSGKTPAAPTETSVATAAPKAAAPLQPESPLSQDDLPLIKEFITEALSHIDSAEAQLLKLEQDPKDTDAVNAVFRSFHTVKGVAGFLNLRQLSALAHYAESLLDLARQGTIEVSGDIANIILEASDMLKLLVLTLDEAVKQKSTMAMHAPLPDLLARLRAATESAGKTSIAAAPTAPAIPPTVQPAASAQPAAPAGAETRDQESKQQAAPRKAATAQVGEATIKVATERLDSLINMVGELVIAQSMVNQDVGGSSIANPRLSRNLGHLTKMTRQLQELSMSMRMVPIQGVFQKMNRLVRDLAQKAGKQVELTILGGETELDRNVVEAIGDPLVHMIRNSLDHGIETTEDRRKAGKNPVGHVELRAAHRAGSIVIEIHDDGRGLNKQKILKKATQVGIVREGQELSDAEIFKLIFHAGLSTADKLTDVSGRGVGMDVVKRNIEALRGRIDISSVEGQGTVFTIHLPLTLAVIDGMLVRVGSERYILPIANIERTLQPKPDQITTVHARGEMCMVRGELLPLYRLHRIFDVKPRTEDPAQALVIIVQDNHRRGCLLVDELIGQQEVVIKSLGSSFGKIRGISGGAILGDGNVSLILDVTCLMEFASKNQPKQSTLNTQEASHE